MAPKSKRMPKEERIRLMVEYLDDNEVALPAKVLHENLHMYRNATFSYRTIQRLLNESVDRGIIEIVDRNKPYYRITDRGREYVVGELDASNLDPTADEE